MELKSDSHNPKNDGHFEKRLDKKTKVNFKIYDVTTWETNNYNTHIAHHHKKWRQSDIEIWSVNGIWQVKCYRNIL